jgi:hypothetical protein
MALAETAALLGYAYILEDSQIIPKEPRPHPQKLGGVREGIYAPGCATLDRARISGGWE